jgi:hypothetical protein
MQLTPEQMALAQSDPQAFAAMMAAQAQPAAPAAVPAVQQTQLPATDLSAVPEHLRALVGADNSAKGLGTSNNRSKISIKGKVFRFIEEGGERIHPMGQPLEVIILAADPLVRTAKAFYLGAYVDGGDNIPVCYSSDGETPDAGCDMPQCATCTACPHNVFGTAKNQDGTPGKGKACGDSKKLYVVAPGTNAANGGMGGVDGPIYEMSIPPTSLNYKAAKKWPGSNYKSLGAVGQQLQQNNLPIYAVKMRIDFVAQEASPVLSFDIAGYPSAEELAIIQERINGGEIDSILPSKNKEPAVIEETAQLPAPAAEAPTPATPAAPAAPAPAATCPLGAPAGHTMTAMANGNTYQSFIAQNWTDELLIQHGYMI